MMRSIWSGSINFGLVNVPVKLYAATEDKDIRFNLLHKEDGSRVVYKKFCADEQIEVEDDEIVKGYEYAKNQYTRVEPQDFDTLPQSVKHTVDILEFVDLSEIDPIYFQKSYYLVPQKGAGKPYSLLRRAMQQSNKIAMAKMVLREKEHLAIMRVYDRALMMAVLFYPDEIRGIEQLDELTDIEVTDKETQMAISLIEALSGTFNPANYKDTYRESLLELINQKIEGKSLDVPTFIPPKDQIVDLMEALRASVAKATAA